MAALRLVRKWGIPLATATAAPLLIPVVLADSDKREPVRPSQLPIYEEPHEQFNFEYHTRDKTSFEEGLGIVRSQVLEVVEATRSTRERIVHIYETGVAHSMGTFDMIRDEDNVLAQAGFIIVGGLTGLVIARRKKGILKKLLYTTTGVVAASSLCYPQKSYSYGERFSRCAYKHAVNYGTIAYNFMAGVQPQSKLDQEKVNETEISTDKIEIKAEISEDVTSLLPEDKPEEQLVEEIILAEESTTITPECTEEIFADHVTEESSAILTEELVSPAQESTEENIQETDLISAPQSESLIEALAHELAAPTPENDSLESEVPDNEGLNSLAGEASSKESSTNTGLLATAVNSAVAAVEGDSGQSNPDDTDMYTTRD